MTPYEIENFKELYRKDEVMWYLNVCKNYYGVGRFVEDTTGHTEYYIRKTKNHAWMRVPMLNGKPLCGD
ncbi:MAG: hypothetical protein KC897_12415 [Candidatus Omnitrophica bacterium]|nr:hypothetical protein [Candidatus Omnitrophota bacterium]